MFPVNAELSVPKCIKSGWLNFVTVAFPSGETGSPHAPVILSDAPSVITACIPPPNGIEVTDNLLNPVFATLALWNKKLLLVTLNVLADTFTSAAL